MNQRKIVYDKPDGKAIWADTGEPLTIDEFDRLTRVAAAQTLSRVLKREH